MKLLFLLFLLNVLTVGSIATAQNPISPEGIFIADPAGHVWKDGKLYVYGSLDKSADSYCSGEYHVLSTSNLTHWNLHNYAFASTGNNDHHLYNKDLPFAPDCILEIESH